IVRNTIITSKTSTSSNYMGIIINGSVTGTASSGNNSNENLIEGNTIIGGYYGIYTYGSTTAGLYNTNNVIKDNKIEDFYMYGIYMWGQDGVKALHNDVSRPTRTGVTTTYGVYVSTNMNVWVEGNRVHDIFEGVTANTTSTAYCIYLADDGTTTERNTAINNAVYNIKKTNGTVYGIYVPNYYYWDILHNTVVLDDPSSTAGTTDGIYAYGTSLKVMNNIVYITRGGTGTKHLLNYNTSTATSIATSDNNILYINAPAG